MKKIAYGMIGGMVVALTGAYLAMPKNLRDEVKNSLIDMMCSKKSNCNCPNCNK